MPEPQSASARPAALASLSTRAATPNARSVSAASGKLRQQGTFGGLSTTPVFGSSGPGEQSPMPLTAPRASGTAERIASTAFFTAAKPSTAVPAACMGTRVLWAISPVEPTSAAATLVPPISTPMVMEFGVLLNAEFPLHLFQRVALGFRIRDEHDKELQRHHRREKDKGRASGRGRQHRKDSRNQRIHDPVREAAQALS